MHADLVCGRSGAKLDQGRTIPDRQPAPMRRRLLAPFVRDHAPPRLGARRLGKREFDDALLLVDDAAHQRDIIFLYGSCLESPWKAARAFGVLANNKQPLVSVSSRCMGVGGRRKPQLSSSILAAMDPAPPRRVHRQAGRLVEHDRPASMKIIRSESTENAMNETVGEGKSSPPAYLCGRDQTQVQQPKESMARNINLFLQTSNG